MILVRNARAKSVIMEGGITMSYYEFLGYRSEEEFLEDMLGCNEEYTLDDFFDSYDPE